MATDVDHRREYPLSVYPIKHPLMADAVGINRYGERANRLMRAGAQITEREFGYRFELGAVGHTREGGNGC